MSRLTLAEAEKKSFRNRLQQLKSDIGKSADPDIGKCKPGDKKAVTDKNGAEELTKCSEPSAHAIVVSVLLRSSITKKVLSIWQTKLPTLDSSIVEVTPCFYCASSSTSSAHDNGSSSNLSIIPQKSSRGSVLAENLQRKINKDHTADIKATTVYVILPLGTSKDQFYKWAGQNLSTFSVDDTNSNFNNICYYYLSPDWVFDFIKSPQKQINECDSACSQLITYMHPLHSSLPWAKSLPQHNISTVSVGATTSITTLPDSTSKNTISNHNTTTNERENTIAHIAGGYYPRREAFKRERLQRGERGEDSQDQDQDIDSQDRDECPVFIPPPQKQRKGGGITYACMIDSNPELNPPSREEIGTNQRAEPIKKKTNLNKHITDKFKELYKIYEMEGDVWRARTYKQACSVLEQLSFRVTDSEQLRGGGRPSGKGKGCMGKSVLAKIQEIITTAELSKLSGLQRQHPDIQSRMELDKIWGVGPATAKSLVEQGYNSVAELRAAMYALQMQHSTAASPSSALFDCSAATTATAVEEIQIPPKSNDGRNEEEEEALREVAVLQFPPTVPPNCPLTVQQVIGLNHYEDLLERMDRDEVRDIESLVLTAVKKLDPGACCVVCGSYRRGQPTSGDIDVLIYPDDGREDINILPDLLNMLTLSGFLTDHLTVPHSFQGYYPPLPMVHPPAACAPSRTVSGSCSTRSNTSRISSEGNPAWLTDETLNVSDCDSDGEVDDNIRDNAVASISNLAAHGETKKNTHSKKQNMFPPYMSHSQSLHSLPAPPSSSHEPTGANSLTDNANQAFISSSSSCSPHSLNKDDTDRHTEFSPDPGTETNNNHDSDKYTNNERKRKRQAQLLRHSVDFSTSHSGPTASYMGVCRLPYSKNSQGTRREYRHRRIDLKSYPRSYLPFAMLYFTGSAHFNRSMRLYCRQKNLTLNDKGLFPCTRDQHAIKTYTSAKSVSCRTEHDVFKVLGLQYKEPWNRNTFDNANIIIPSNLGRDCSATTTSTASDNTNADRS